MLYDITQELALFDDIGQPIGFLNIQSVWSELYTGVYIHESNQLGNVCSAARPIFRSNPHQGRLLMLEDMMTVLLDVSEADRDLDPSLVDRKELRSKLSTSLGQTAERPRVLIPFLSRGMLPVCTIDGRIDRIADRKLIDAVANLCDERSVMNVYLHEKDHYQNYLQES